MLHHDISLLIGQGLDDALSFLVSVKGDLMVAILMLTLQFQVLDLGLQTMYLSAVVLLLRFEIFSVLLLSLSRREPIILVSTVLGVTVID